MPDAALVHAAVADAWEVEGRIRGEHGGGSARLRGARVMASGLPQSWWNAADVMDHVDVDVAGVRAYFAHRRARFGFRVAAGTPWPHGERVVRLRLMALHAADFAPAPPVGGLEIALSDDLDTIVALDAAAFASQVHLMRRWIAPHLGKPDVETAVATTAHGEPVATAYTIRSHGDAGPCVLLGGVGVLRTHRRHGIGTAISGWLLERSLWRGAMLAHLRPDHAAAARIYARLGFTEVEGLDVYEEES